MAGLQQRRVVSEKEERILAFHEAGHPLMSHLVGDPQPVQKVTIVSRGQALGYTLNTPQEDRYLQTKKLRDAEQASLTDGAYSEAIRLLDKETLLRAELEELFADVPPESDSASTVGHVVPLANDG